MKSNNEEKDSSLQGLGQGTSSAEEYSLMQKSQDGGILGSKE